MEKSWQIAPWKHLIEYIIFKPILKSLNVKKLRERNLGCEQCFKNTIKQAEKKIAWSIIKVCFRITAGGRTPETRAVWWSTVCLNLFWFKNRQPRWQCVFLQGKPLLNNQEPEDKLDFYLILGWKLTYKWSNYFISHLHL